MKEFKLFEVRNPFKYAQKNMLESSESPCKRADDFEVMKVCVWVCE